MDQDYAQKLKAQVQAIFDRGPGGDLPQWPAEYDEAAYNKLAAKTLGGALLDRRLIYTDLHRRGIEVMRCLTLTATIRSGASSNGARCCPTASSIGPIWSNFLAIEPSRLTSSPHACSRQSP
jgi:hypothetical protein